jgi:hypothetical protein
MPPLCRVEKSKVHEPVETGAIVAITGVTGGVGRASVTTRWAPEEQLSVLAGHAHETPFAHPQRIERSAMLIERFDGRIIGS